MGVGQERIDGIGGVYRELSELIAGVALRKYHDVQPVRGRAIGQDSLQWGLGDRLWCSKRRDREYQPRGPGNGPEPECGVGQCLRGLRAVYFVAGQKAIAVPNEPSGRSGELFSIQTTQSSGRKNGFPCWQAA